MTFIDDRQTHLTMTPEQDWTSLRIGDICTKIGSGATPRGGKEVYLSDGPFTLIRSQNVYNNRFSHDGLVYINKQHAAELNNVEVRTDDVLLNITGDSVARACQAPKDILPARVNQHVLIIRPDPGKLSSRFLRYALVSPEIQTMLLSWAGSGGTRNALTKGMIEAIIIRAPVDVADQRAIANILSILDERIGLNHRMNETLEAMARALFQSWFVDFDPVRAKMEGRNTGLPKHIADLFPDRMVTSELGEIPESWKIKKLGELCSKPQYGYTASAKDDLIGPKFLRIKDINKKTWIEWESVPYCKITDHDYKKYKLNKGDVLISRMADPGHGVMVEEAQDAVFASYLIRFRPQCEVYSRLLQYWLRSNSYWDMVSAMGAGTTRVSLNAMVLSEFPLVIPCIPVAKFFGEVISNLRARVVANASEDSSLICVRDSLLPKLITGELRVRREIRKIEKV